MLTAHQFIAHRGSPFRGPENTLPSIQFAIDAGAVYFEVDIQLSADRVPVLYHDNDLQRISHRSESICDLSWKQLQSVRAFDPLRFGDRFRETPIPSLQQLMDRLGDWPTAQVFIELKVDSMEHFGLPVVLERVVPIMIQSPHRAQIAAVISKHDVAIEMIRQSTELAIGWVLPEWSQAHRQRAEQLAPEYMFCNYEFLPDVAEQVWTGDWKWAIYTVNDKRLAMSLLQRGMQLVETDDIAEMLSV